jgi:sedoheptulokinase
MSMQEIEKMTELSREMSRFYEEDSVIVIGIDIGTTTISVSVVDLRHKKQLESRTVFASADIASDASYAHMQDAELILDQAQKMLSSLMRKYKGIRAIGITGQMHGILYYDRKGNALSPLYTWQDQRAGERIGEGETYAEYLEKVTGYKVPAGYGFATHFYNLKNRLVPTGAAGFCTIHDFLAMKLTGNFTPLIHATNAASFGFFDVNTNTFDAQALEKAGMSGFIPDVTDETVTIGNYHDIPVAVAIGDNQAAFLGSVKHPDRSALANFGTGSQISLIGDLADPEPPLESRPHINGNKLLSGSALCGGKAYALLERFFRLYAANIGIEKSQYEVMNSLALRALDEHALTVRTTFCGTRANPDERGSILNISEDNFTPEALIVGTLTGMAAELHGMFLQMNPVGIDTLVLTGNTVRKNQALVQILSRVFGMKTAIPIHIEEASFGAALFAALASGIADASDLSECIKYDYSR